MNEFSVVEISGRQYLVTSGAELVVDKLANQGEYVCDKVILAFGDGGLRVGSPFLEGEKLTFVVVGDEKQPKIRVATYSAKANTRRVKGSRAVKTRIRLK